MTTKECAFSCSCPPMAKLTSCPCPPWQCSTGSLTTCSPHSCSVLTNTNGQFFLTFQQHNIFEFKLNTAFHRKDHFCKVIFCFRQDSRVTWPVNNPSKADGCFFLFLISFYLVATRSSHTSACSVTQTFLRERISDRTICVCPFVKQYHLHLFWLCKHSQKDTNAG